jgi:hypothetical protein
MKHFLSAPIHKQKVCIMNNLFRIDLNKYLYWTHIARQYVLPDDTLLGNYVSYIVL